MKVKVVKQKKVKLAGEDYFNLLQPDIVESIEDLAKIINNCVPEVKNFTTKPKTKVSQYLANDQKYDLYTHRNQARRN